MENDIQCQRSEELGLHVIDEDDHETLLVHRISTDDIYRKQEGSSQPFSAFLVLLTNHWIRSLRFSVMYRHYYLMERTRGLNRIGFELSGDCRLLSCMVCDKKKKKSLCCLLFLDELPLYRSFFWLQKWYTFIVFRNQICTMQRNLHFSSLNSKCFSLC